MSNKIVQGSDVKTQSDVSNINQLPNDDKFYVSANSINKTMRQAIIDGNLGSNTPSPIITNSTLDEYDMTGEANKTVMVHKYSSFAYYLLPTPSAGLIYVFENEQDIPADGTNIIVGPTNNKIYWQSNSVDYDATLTTATYTKTTLATEIKTQMDASADPNVFTVSWDQVGGKYSFTANTNTFKFMFSTNTTNSARKHLGLLESDGSLALIQYSECFWKEMRIKPATGHVIKFGSNLIESPGYIALSRKGVSITLMGVDTSTWVMFNSVEEQHRKNTTIGFEKDVALVGRDSWVSKAGGGTARYQLTGFSLNGYGYICDGYDGTVRSYVDQYNDSANTWTSKAGGGTGRDRLAGFSLNGYGYICNGDDGAVRSYVDQYNDSANTWTSKAGGGTVRERLAGFSLNGYGYICDGYDGTARSYVDQYNDSANTWTSKAGGGTARYHLTGFSLNGYGYICNGTDGVYRSYVDQYNDSANTWTSKAGGGTVRERLAGFSLNGYGYICDGYDGAPSSAVNQYNDSANTWTSKAGGGTARYGLTGFSLNGYGYICDGTDGTNRSYVDQYN